MFHIGKWETFETRRRSVDASPNRGGMVKQIRNVCDDMDIKCGIITDTHIVSEYELHNTLKGYEPVYVNAINNGIRL